MICHWHNSFSDPQAISLAQRSLDLIEMHRHLHHLIVVGGNKIYKREQETKQPRKWKSSLVTSLQRALNRIIFIQFKELPCCWEKCNELRAFSLTAAEPNEICWELIEARRRHEMSERELFKFHLIKSIRVEKKNMSNVSHLRHLLRSPPGDNETMKNAIHIRLHRSSLFFQQKDDNLLQRDSSSSSSLLLCAWRAKKKNSIMLSSQIDISNYHSFHPSFSRS